ncbi:MAG: thioesterase family protein [Caulobacteraceae bacterium]|nr:thioesterase family protein [Caulobacteraceae bacterium]
MSHAYFQYEGGLFLPDRSVRSPWSADQQSGIAISGLLVRAIETAPSPAPMRIARLTIDFLGATLMRPTEARVRIVREGKRMQLIEAELWVEGVLSARAAGLRLADGESPPAEAPPHGFPGPEETQRVPVTRYFDAGHPLETRVARFPSPDGAPGAFWSRFNSIFLAGEPTSATIRTCMAADIATGCASVGVASGWQTPNTDLSVYFARAPHGDWILAITALDIASDGAALTGSTLADEAGVFGFARQTLVLSRPRDEAARKGFT